MKTTKMIFALWLLLLAAQSKAQLSKYDEAPQSVFRGVPLDVIVVADRSGSMSGMPIDELNKALAGFYKELGGRKDLRLGLVTFESNVQTVRQTALVTSGEAAPVLTSTGSTNMTDALKTAQNLLKNRPKDSPKPAVVLLTDGVPDDRAGALSAAAALQQEAHLFALGVMGADKDYLLQMTNANANIAANAQQFSLFFGDVRQSLDAYLLSYHTLGTKARFTVTDTKGWSKE